MPNLLKPTHNMMSNLMANSKQPDPEVGMGATMLMYSDRHAGTIVEVLKNKKGKIVGFVWQQDHAKRTDKNGMSDSQQYEYTPNKEAKKVTVTLRRNGFWIQKGESAKNGTAYSIGHRGEFYDFTK